MVAGKTLLRILGLGKPLLREFVEMHYLQTKPVFLDDGALHDLLGPIHKTSYDEGVRATLAATPNALGYWHGASGRRLEDSMKGAG